MFQFTHPGKGATNRTLPKEEVLRVSIHAPWEGCDVGNVGKAIKLLFVSIHAPWEGCDTTEGAIQLFDYGVSIHAPWEGCDKYPFLFSI